MLPKLEVYTTKISVDTYITELKKSLKVSLEFANSRTLQFLTQAVWKIVFENGL